MTGPKSAVPSRNKRLSWAQIAGISGVSFAAAIGAAFFIPWALRRFAGYAWWVYGSAFIWVAVATGVVALLSMWIWTVGQLAHNVRASWARIDDPSAVSRQRKKVRRGSALAWLIIPVIAALAGATAPDIVAHGSRNGVAQRPTNFATEMRIDRYEVLANNPNEYPWEERSALWVDQTACLAEAGNFLTNHSTREILKSEKFSVVPEEYSLYVEQLGDERVISAVEKIVELTPGHYNLSAPAWQVSAQYADLYEEIAEGSCGINHLSDEERKKWRSDAIELFDAIYAATLAET